MGKPPLPPRSHNLGGSLGHALDILVKHGELILCTDGFFRANASAYSSVTASQIALLKSHGRCRVDVVGSTTFAVAL